MRKRRGVSARHTVLSAQGRENSEESDTLRRTDILPAFFAPVFCVRKSCIGIASGFHEKLKGVIRGTRQSFLSAHRNMPCQSENRLSGRPVAPLPSLPPFDRNSPSDRCRRGFARSCRDPTSDVSAAFSQRRGKHGTRVRELPEPLPSPHPPAGKRSSAPRQTHHFHRPYRLRMKSHRPDTRPAFGRIDRSGHRFRTDTTLRKTAFLDFSTEDTPTENRKRFFRRGRHTHRAFSENKTVGGEVDRNKTDSLISVSGPYPSTPVRRKGTKPAKSRQTGFSLAQARRCQTKDRRSSTILRRISFSVQSSPSIRANRRIASRPRSLKSGEREPVILFGRKR